MRGTSLSREIESICGPYPLLRACFLRETLHLPLGQSICVLSLWQGSLEGKNLVLLPGVGRRESSWYLFLDVSVSTLEV